MAFKKKCNCTPKNSDKYCKICSRIIMKIMLKNEFKHLKVKDTNGQLNCPAWYCFYSKNGHSDQRIKKDMIARLQNTIYANTYNCLIFVDNTNPYSKNKPILHI